MYSVVWIVLIIKEISKLHPKLLVGIDAYINIYWYILYLLVNTNNLFN